MAASAPTTQRWIYGPVPDLLFGCAGSYLLLIALLVVPVVNGWVDEWMRAVAASIGLFINAPHYGATLLRVYQHRQDRQKYALFALWISAGLVALFVVATRSPVLGSALVTLYVTWSPWHFAGQNYGLGMMFLRRRGAPITSTAKRLFYASFFLSFALTLFTIHGEDPGLSVAPVPAATQAKNAIYPQISLGIPEEIATPVIVLLALGYVAVLLGAGVLLLRASRLRDLAPAFLIVLMQASWFAVPALLRLTGTFTTAHVALSSVWISAAHSIQYLWVTSYYAKKTDDPQWLGRYLAKTFLAGAALLVIPGLLFAPRAFGVVPYWGFSILLFSVINIHHFILDGAIWKLRDGRVANALLRSTTPELASPIGPGPTSLRRVAILTGWAVGLVAVLIGVAALWEDELGRRALREGNYLRAITAAERLRTIGRESENYHRVLAYSMWKNGASPELVLEHFQRSLEIRPTAKAWTDLGHFRLNPRTRIRKPLETLAGSDEPQLNDRDAALAAFENALGLDADYFPAVIPYGLLLAERGDFGRAREALARAESLAPGDPQVADFAKRLAAMENAS